MTSKAKKWLVICISIIALAALIVAGVFLTEHSQSGEEKSGQTPVQLSVSIPKDFKVGVIHSLTDDPHVEASWLNAAEGLQVGAYRMDPKGNRIAIEVKNDRGTEEGAQSAVESLVKDGVSGIIVASSGPHTQAIADAAAAEKIPTIFLYEGDVSGDGVWSFAPNRERNHDVLADALADLSLTKAIVFDSEGNLKDLAHDQYYAFTASTDLAALADTVTKQLEGRGTRADAVVISGNSASQLALIKELQTRAITLPIFLTSQAQAPKFGNDLAKNGISQSNIVTVGTQSVDMLALGSDKASERAAAFFTAMRLMNDETRRNLLKEQQFNDVIGYADALSHDAIVSFAQAAEDAHSSDASDVLNSLGGLSISGEDGVINGTLDFTQATPTLETIGAVRMTSQNPGLRDGKETAVYWFSE